VFKQLFEEIVARCLEAGPVQGNNLSVDGSFVEAKASKESRIPREQLSGSGESEPHRASISLRGRQARLNA
jgi:hypothetical protein